MESKAENDLSGWTENEVARIAVADQLRRGLHGLVGGDHDTEALIELAAVLDTVLAPLEDAPPAVLDMGKWADRTEIAIPADNAKLFSGASRPVSGPANPWSIPLEVYRRGDRAVTTTELGAGFQGAPQRSHGGVVSAIFDDLCGFLLTFDKNIAFTAYLTVNYHAGTPLHQPITFSAWVERTEGRKLFLRGECRIGTEDPEGELLTSCDALFLTIDEMPALDADS